MSTKTNLVQLELARIADEHGGLLNPEVVVQEAINPTSPLHDYFEWDDGLASDQWRLQQARQLIRVQVTLIDPKSQRWDRVYVSLGDDRGENGYRRMIDVMSDTDLSEKLLSEAKRDMLVFQEKYNHLQQLEAVIKAMQVVAGEERQ